MGYILSYKDAWPYRQQGFLVGRTLYFLQMVYLFLPGCTGSSLLCRLSPVAASGGLLFVASCGLLTVLAYLIGDHGL